VPDSPGLLRFSALRRQLLLALAAPVDKVRHARLVLAPRRGGAALRRRRGPHAPARPLARRLDPRLDQGTCPTGGGHDAQGLNFDLPHDVPESAHSQGAWRMCRRCAVMFFDGFPDKGACPADGAHARGRITYVLAHDMETAPNHQSDWRFCHHCAGMFFDGFPTKGTCPAGGTHDAQGFVFVLPTTAAHPVDFD
jgi:hypothetical protein